MIHKLLPPAVRARLLGRLRGYERSRRVAVTDGIPTVKLEERHLENLTPITNRDRLLELLPKDGVVAELGTDTGDFSEMIFEVTSPRELHLIDLWGSERYHDGKAKTVSKRFHREIEKGRVMINRGLSTDILQAFPDHYFDWVYIDTAHTHEVTRNELQLCNRKVKPEGLICGHDSINASRRNAVKYGAVETVHEFCVKNDWELRYLTNETHQHRSLCIRRMI